MCGIVQCERFEAALLMEGAHSSDPGIVAARSDAEALTRRFPDE